jgi:hypothetical protein
MKFDWSFAGAVVLAALAAGCSSAASEDGPDACPGGGSALEVEGSAVCAYPAAIIETGFRCPDVYVHAYPASTGYACT